MGNDPNYPGGMDHPRPQPGYPQPPGDLQQTGYPQQPSGYPPYGPPPAPHKGRGCGTTLAIAAGVGFVLLVIIAIAGMLAGADDSDDGGETGAGDDTPAAGTDDGQDVYAIGQTAHTGEFDVTVHAVQDPFPPPSEFDTPAAPDHRFVAVEATVTNTSAEPTGFSTLAGVELVDQLDRPWSIAITSTELPSLDAVTVAPGEARRGWVVFSVPPDATELRIRIKGNLTANGSVFELN